MAVFEVVFHGRVRADVAPAQARARIGQLFQVADQQLDLLFSGRRIVIKQGLDQVAAEKYRQAIERAGALCEVETMAQAALQSTPAQGSATASLAARRLAVVEPRDEFMAAFRDVDAPDLPLAPLGSDIQENYAEHAPVNLDLSAFHLTPLGADLDPLPEARQPAVPDTTHLRVLDGN